MVEPVNIGDASKLANILEGLEFPADKAKTLSHINQKSSLSGNENKDFGNY